MYKHKASENEYNNNNIKSGYWSQEFNDVNLIPTLKSNFMRFSSPKIMSVILIFS